MRGRTLRALATGAWLLVASAPSSAFESYETPGADRYFTVDWEPGQRSGRPTVVGQVFNDSGSTMARVRVLVESVSAEGQVVATTLGYIIGEITPFTRRGFEVRVPGTAPAYRVRVVNYETLESASFP